MKMLVKNVPILSALSVLIGAICFLLFSLLGSYIDEQGILQEPFGLIPIGFLFTLLGFYGLLVSLIPSNKFIFAFFALIILAGVFYFFSYFKSLNAGISFLYDEPDFFIPIAFLLICLAVFVLLYILISNVFTSFKNKQ